MDAYAALLTSVIKLEDVENLMEPWNFRSPVDTGVYDQMKQKWDTANGDFTRAMAAVELCGSSEIRRQVRLLAAAHLDVIFQYTNIYSRVRNQDVVYKDQMLDAFNWKMRERKPALDDFTRLARTDLGIPDR